MSKGKKRIIIILIIAAILILLGRFMLPRISMWLLVKEMEPHVVPPAEAFTAYDITLEDGQSVSLDGLSMTIPNDFTLRETNDKYSLVYDHPDETIGCTVLSVAQDVSHMNLTVKENAEALMAEYFYKISCKNLSKGFRDLGYGNPDSAYNVYKTAALLKADDYDFGNWSQTYAYIVSCGLNATIFDHLGHDKYIYETEDICGIVFCWNLNSNHHAYAYMFSTDDLNTMYTLSLSSVSKDELYGMLNSIVIE